MVESISHIQQLLAEANFVEAQRVAEQLLNQNLSTQDSEKILELYFDCLKFQNRSHPTEKLIKLIEIKIKNQSGDIDIWFSKFTHSELEKYEFEISLLKITYFEERGRLAELYNSIKDFHNYLYTYRIPSIPQNIQNIIQKYFSTDFHLKVQSLAFDLLRMDLGSAEEKTKEIILSGVINQSARDTKIKLNLLITVLSSLPVIHQLDMYRNLSILLVNGIQDKKDFKKIIECIIYIDDFKLQLIILKLLQKLELNSVIESFIPVIKKNSKYNFVFIDKYFPETKNFFIQAKKNTEDQTSAIQVDITLDQEFIPLIGNEVEVVNAELSDHEVLLAKLLKVQEFSAETLLDLAVNFIQSDFLNTAMVAVRIVLEKTNDRDIKLKAYYLLVTTLLKTGDYRAALDSSLIAMDMAETQNDLLSFLYGQAEAYIKLKDKNKAAKTLEKIISIDKNYRLAKEKLEMLNAI